MLGQKNIKLCFGQSCDHHRVSYNKNTIHTQLIYSGIYMHHKKTHTAKFNSHIFTIKMFQ